jgi:soluble lytic murein transglycosylase-like protein
MTSPLALAALAIMVLTMPPKKQPIVTVRRKPFERRPDRARMVELIRAEAARQGVPAAVALAFADVESGLDPSANGDLGWSELEGGARYEKHVLNNPRLANNPARTNRRAWHSYGLYQLLAPHHVLPLELPSALYSPQINAQRGIAQIKTLLRLHGGDVAEARLAYTGLSSRSDPAAIERVLSRFAPVYQHWSEQT